MIAYKEDIFIGQMIKDELKKQGRSASWLAKRIYCERTNVYKLFKRKSLDLEQLMQISRILDHDFLKDCYQ
ncbi:MAG: helix-turn-helix domain-containing protein [Bacteroidales bacterium]|jgi:hypothetical protein|nr:helix-turn-helix domain-containing protein [Bacteroidales bacterium]MBQ6101148.1 helix-turn-helix domain-containing protein [Bacteroidales bacterium]MBR0539695.1 helix-turn-helix domain-containing protein [Bacteroidales bacterium]MBR3426330.1 helix-turn-helix domain-containing protein [Bacteroidales bacterium]MBR5377672.1 helix-turn-helix domain-containing protein [Bacteroidales bacterium]